MKITISWVNRNVAEDGIRVFRSTAPFTDVSAMTPLTTLSPGATTYVDNAVVQGTLYYYRLQPFKGTDAILGKQLALAAVPYTGPGPQALTLGDWELGYFGEVPFTDFIRGDDLAFACGLTVGTNYATASSWLKYAYKGKILFVSKMPVRHTVTWQALYEKGLVYGVDNNGPIIPSGVTATNQKKIVTVLSDQYLVRCLKGATTNPATFTRGTGTAINEDLGFVGSEFSDLMYPVINTIPSEQQIGNLQSFTDTLVFPNATYATVCQESTVAGGASILIRGISSAPAGAASLAPNASSASLAMGNVAATTRNATWRPVLELQL